FFLGEGSCVLLPFFLNRVKTFRHFPLLFFAITDFIPNYSPTVGNNYNKNVTNNRFYCKNAVRPNLQKCGIGYEA
ncbi:uncharacterized protein PgNI_03696, partial [Pyricularia grisea]|uniref:Uncharacterized protein n=1 Tax=Pyricularia grisea TaxID=148305 RepID=A0A6P8B828_PYRGI